MLVYVFFVNPLSTGRLVDDSNMEYTFLHICYVLAVRVQVSLREKSLHYRELYLFLSTVGACLMKAWCAECLVILQTSWLLLWIDPPIPKHDIICCGAYNYTSPYHTKPWFNSESRPFSEKDGTIAVRAKAVSAISKRAIAILTTVKGLFTLRKYGLQWQVSTFCKLVRKSGNP